VILSGVWTEAALDSVVSGVMSRPCCVRFSGSPAYSFYASLMLTRQPSPSLSFVIMLYYPLFSYLCLR
jgi:hypothetical protein